MIEVFKTLFNLLSNLDNPEEGIKEIAKLRQNINDNIVIYSCDQIKGVSTIIVHRKKDKIEKISFGDEILVIKLCEIESLLGSFKTAYSFRDDMTNFIFMSNNNSNIQEIVFSKDGRWDDKELINSHNICFNNFTLNFK